MKYGMAFFFCILLIHPGLPVPAGELSPEVRAALEAIRPMDAYQYCKILSSERFAGRLTGHEGYTDAAKWAAGQFDSWGLKPVDKDRGFLQAFPSPYSVVDRAEMVLFLKEGESEPGEEPSFKEVSLQPGKEFLPLLFSDGGDKTAGLAFAGWGISAPGLNYDDYEGLNVQGKFVLCFRGTPDPANTDFDPFDHHRTRMQTAVEKGALGLIYIYPDVHAHPNGDRIEGFMGAIISEKIADDILKDEDLEASDLKKQLGTFHMPVSFPLQSRIKLKVKARYFPDGVGYNVAGYVEGSDPVLRETCLVIGGHLDHCGRHMGFLYAGADDNASGCAVVMAAAGAFAGLETKPRRSVLFVLFGGEEMGLLGSNYFADHPPSRFKKIDAMFNLDMAGAGDGAGCAHSPEPPGLKETIEASDVEIRILKKYNAIKRVGVRSSDFAPFYSKGIPCASFWSNGPHLHYHQTGDTIYRINPDIMADIARLVFLSAYNRAER